MPFYVESRGRVALLHLNEGENRFNFENINSILRCLDEVEANPEFIALVTIGHGKYFSLGLDLDWIGEIISTDPPRIQEFSLISNFLYYRLITFPLPTIAAINGHSYGAGAFLALCHDARVMREDRGYFCLPEAKLTLPFRTRITQELVRHRIPISIQSTALLSHTFTAKQALSEGLIHAQHSVTELLDRCTHLAERLAGSEKGLDKDNLKRIKLNVFKWSTAAYTEDQQMLSHSIDPLSAYKSKL